MAVAVVAAALAVVAAVVEPSSFALSLCTQWETCRTAASVISHAGMNTDTDTHAHHRAPNTFSGDYLLYAIHLRTKKKTTTTT